MAQPTRSVSCVALCLQCRHSWTKCRHLTSILRKKKTQSLEYEAGDDDGDASHTLRPFLTMLLPRSTPIYPDLSRLDGICDDLLIQFSALLDEVLPEQALCAVTPVGAHWALRIASCSFIFISAARLTLMRLLQGSMQFLIPGGACVDVC